jgi:hypothetical protein
MGARKEAAAVATIQNAVAVRDIPAGSSHLDGSTTARMISKGMPTSEIYHRDISPRSNRLCINGIRNKTYATFNTTQTIAAPMAPYFPIMRNIAGTRSNSAAVFCKRINLVQPKAIWIV